MNYEWLRYRWHRIVAVVAAVVGVVLLIAGWVGVSGSSVTTEQIPYLASGAVGGLFALGVAATLWLSADLKDEFAKLDEIYRFLQGREGRGDGAVSDMEAPAGTVAYDTEREREVRREEEELFAGSVPRRRPLRARRSSSDL
jgi:hypothetical protein